jgi:ribonuclease BN (tRNA processing enzyme)
MAGDGGIPDRHPFPGGLKMGQKFRMALHVALVLAASLNAGAAAERDRAPAAAPAAASLILLGTAGGPVLRAARSQPASMLLVGDTAYLVDAGDGAAAQIVKSGHSLPQVRAVFLTHQHMDHTAGLGGIIAFNWSVVRKTPLAIYGPPGTEQLVARALSYFALSEETFRRESPSGTPMAGIPRPTDLRGPGLAYEDDNVRVTAAENSHYATVCHAADCPDMKSFSYRFELKRGRAPFSIVFSGDTGPSDAVARMAADADVLVSEIIDLPSTVTFLKDYVRLPEDSLKPMIAHMEKEHMTPEEVGRLARQSRAGTVVLTHFVWGNQEPQPDVRKLVEGVSRIYDGRIVAGSDLQVIPLAD